MIRSSLKIYELLKMRDEDPMGPNSDVNFGFRHDLRAAHAECPDCHGVGTKPRFWGRAVCSCCAGTGYLDKTTHEEWVAHLFFCVVNKLNLHKSDLIAEVALLKDRLGLPEPQ